MTTNNYFKGFLEVGIILILFTFVFVQGCSNEDVTPEKRINREYKKYIDRFWLEASRRGVSIDTTNLEIVTVENLSNDVGDFCGLGLFNFNGSGINRVEVVQNSFCWEERTDLQRENFIFHELGHAVLGRFHLEDILHNGSPKSIMCSICSNFDTYTEYSLYKKSYYLDELFDASTSNPHWAQIKTVRSNIYTDSFDAGDLKWTFVVSDGSSNNNGYIGRLSTERSVSGPNSLMIEATAISDPEASAYWSLMLDDPDIPAFVNFFLDYQIETINVEGSGASMSVYGYDPGGRVTFFDTTEDKLDLDATRSFSHYQLANHCFPENVERLEIRFEILPNTTGQIFLDDVVVEVHK